MIGKSLILLFILLIVVVGAISFGAVKLDENSFEETRGEILSQLSLAIKEAEKNGKYKCCIDPPCTMCYLGDWLWEDGTCDCDGMIVSGQWDKVCPQCGRGIEEGRCKSEIGSCSIEL